jgi:hypothetical protein
VELELAPDVVPLPPTELVVEALVVVVPPTPVVDVPPLWSLSPPQAAINMAGMNGPKNLRILMGDSFEKV